MSKNLGNIPQQVEMSEEQQQTFTNGINKGRKLERERIISLLADPFWHSITFPGIHNYDCPMCRTIALIEGETK